MLAIRICKALKSHSARFNLNINFTVGGSRAVFFGPSGSGKTLTMQAVAGLLRPQSGKIIAAGSVFYESSRNIWISPQKRHVGYMLQNYALFPHLTVLENVAYPHSGLLGCYLSRPQKRTALAWLERFGIANLAEHRPEELSGGQKQRVALARVINYAPKLLLLDEPFSALDPLLRERMRQEIMAILADLAVPVVIITHDPDDVEVFAENLVLFNAGSARTIPDWKKIRASFPTAGDALRWLESEGCADRPQD